MSTIFSSRDTAAEILLMPGKPAIRAFFDEATNSLSYLVADPATGEIQWEHRFNVYLTDVPNTRLGWSSVVGDPATGRVYALGVWVSVAVVISGLLSFLGVFGWPAARCGRLARGCAPQVPGEITWKSGQLRAVDFPGTLSAPSIRQPLRQPLRQRAGGRRPGVDGEPGS